MRHPFLICPGRAVSNRAKRPLQSLRIYWSGKVEPVCFAGVEMKSTRFYALIVVSALLIGSVTTSLHAQDDKSVSAGPSYPSGLEIAFAWQYSCPDGRGCSFSCPGSGGASNVTKLSIYLGAISLHSTDHAAGVFYEFSTMQIPRANGFALTTGISTLSCQVQGMSLDFSGPKDTPTGSFRDNR